VNAPVASLMFLALGLAGAWWFRGSMDQRETNGLRAQIGALKEQINVFEQRLKLAGEQEQVAVKATQAAKEEIAVLKGLMNMRASREEIAATTSSVETHILEIGRAQDKVIGTLQTSDDGTGVIMGSPRVLLDR
jgi:hypothetical protein